MGAGVHCYLVPCRHQQVLVIGRQRLRESHQVREAQNSDGETRAGAGDEWQSSHHHSSDVGVVPRSRRWKSLRPGEIYPFKKKKIIDLLV